MARRLVVRLRMARGGLFLLGLLGLVAGPSGCSSPSTSSNDSHAGPGFTADQVCALVTQAEVSTAVGTAVDPGVPSGVNAPSCTWLSADSKVGATIAATAPSSVGKIPFGLQGTASAHVTAVMNVGDSAFFASAATGPNAELDIAKGARAITITVGNTRDPSYDQTQQEAAELSLGTAAAPRM